MAKKYQYHNISKCFRRYYVCIWKENSIEKKALEMPDVFSPNNDGKNDLLKPTEMYGISKADITIYNRWGVEIYTSKNLTQGWDGKKDGKDCEDGVYYWTVNYTDIGGAKSMLKGFVTLMR